MGEVRLNLTNFVTIGLIAFAAVYGFNRLASFTGNPQLKA